MVLPSVGRPETIGFLLNKAMAGNFGILKEARTRRFLDRGLKPPENIDYPTNRAMHSVAFYSAREFSRVGPDLKSEHFGSAGRA